MIEVTMPQLGETMEEAEILNWLKAPGDRVERGEPLLEVQTDKITVEVPALVSGTLVEILAPPGTSVRVGSVIARLNSDSPASSIEDQVGKSGSTGAQASKVTPSNSSQPAATFTSKPRASPAARRLARELNIDLNTLSGTGPNQRITTDDVRFAASVLEPDYRFTRLEEATGRVTGVAFREIPHFYLRIRVEVTKLLQYLSRLRDQKTYITINDLFVFVCARVLKRHPRLNASLTKGGLKLHPEINIGVITSTPQGLATIVLPHADTLSLDAIHERIFNVRRKLENGRATVEEISGATFCISNLGMYGIEEFNAIILPPNVAILAIGTVQEDVIVADWTLRFAKTLRLTLSADHRVIGGVEGAEFLKDLRSMLEVPNSWGLDDG